MKLDLNSVCDCDLSKLLILLLQTIKTNVKKSTRSELVLNIIQPFYFFFFFVCICELKILSQKHPSVIWQTENKLQLRVVDYYSLQWQAEATMLVHAQSPWQKIHKHKLSFS